MARSGSRPGKAMLILALVVLTILALADLTSSTSLLRSAWHSVFPSETRGEQMRDNILDRVRPPR